MNYFLCIAADPKNPTDCISVSKRCADESIYAIFNLAERDRLHQISSGDIIILNCQHTFVAWGEVKGEARDENTTIGDIRYICKIPIKKWHCHNAVPAAGRVKKMMMYPQEEMHAVIKRLIPNKAAALCEEIKRI
jgi:hypothetical protein